MTLTPVELITFGIGAWLLMDGLVFGLLPGLMKQLIAYLREADETDIVRAGLLAAAIGAGIVYVSVRF